ncbi:amidohydrolase family protein [Novosphingobium aquiterrae]|uniref:Amidohydrolase family protein n=1 Tax=Novosphingobium aquiterrae TaxID=624388 RepID=A0ABV6PHM5_9SPHN
MQNLARFGAFIALAALADASLSAQQPREPIIDVHVHALKADDQGPPPLAMCTPIDPMPTWDTAKPVMQNFIAPFKQPACKDPVWSPTSDAEVMRRTLAVMERHNVYGVVSGRAALLSAWKKAAPQRVIPSLTPDFPLKPGFEDELRQAKAAGDLAVIGELGFEYEGVSVADPALEPLWAAAEKQDIPVAIHFGPGPPGVAYMPGMGYRARLSSPLLLEDVLVKHPRLRVNVMHAGFPMLDDTLALLYAHPQVYLDTGVIVYTQPRPAFYRYLQALVEAGFGQRIMFGSDQMVWPETMERSIKVIEEAPFLTRQQKRDILYNNAARFLRLDAETIARHKRG